MKNGFCTKFSKGLTILEMVIAMAIMAVVFTVLFPQIRGIQNSWASRETTGELIQNGRVLVDFMNKALSKACKVTDVSNSAESLGYIEFEDQNGITYRFEVGPTDYVRFGVVDSLADMAGPVNRFQFSCFSLEDFITPTTDVNTIRFVKTQVTFTSSSGREETFDTSAFLRPNGNSVGNPVVIIPGVAIKSNINCSGSSAIFDSYNSGNGAYGPGNCSNSAVVTLNSTASSAFFLTNSAILKGDAYIGPGGNINTTISLSGGAQITGSSDVLSEVIDIPNLSAPMRPPFTDTSEGNFKLTGSSTQTINSDRYFNKIQLLDNSILYISGNVTILINNEVEVSSGAKIQILSNSCLNMYPKNNCTIAGQLNSNTADPAKLKIYMTGSTKFFTMSGSSRVYALLQNPNGGVKVLEQSQFYGRIKAETLEANSGIHIDLDSNFDGASGSVVSGQILP